MGPVELGRYVVGDRLVEVRVTIGPVDEDPAVSIGSTEEDRGTLDVEAVHPVGAMDPEGVVE